MNSNQFSCWLEKKNQPSSEGVFEKPLIMGILNITTDSFFDGGEFLSTDRACEHAFHLIAQGADIIDIGGESSRPGAAQISLETELNRILPVIEQLRLYTDICISVDTYKPAVMKAVIDAGANMINDIYALRQEGALAMAAKLDVPICLLHMQGQPDTMQHNPHYPEGIMMDLHRFFEERLFACAEVGINQKRLILDPGFGFGKTVKDNLHMLYAWQDLHAFNLPLLLGASRKSTIGIVLDKEVHERLIGSISIAVYAALKGVGIIRTHDVNETNQALQMINAIYQ